MQKEGISARLIVVVRQGSWQNDVFSDYRDNRALLKGDELSGNTSEGVVVYPLEITRISRILRIFREPSAQSSKNVPP